MTTVKSINFGKLDVQLRFSDGEKGGREILAALVNRRVQPRHTAKNDFFQIKECLGQQYTNMERP